MPCNRLNLWLLAVTLIGMLFSGCLPENCLNRLPELGNAKANISPLMLTDDPSLDPATGLRRGAKKRTPPPPPPRMTPVCTEFAAMRAQDQEVLIFVDANQTNVDGSGQTWETAKRSISDALTSAFDIREIEINSGAATKRIHIVVAGGNYSHEHEFGGEPTARNASILSFDGRRADILRQIRILGGYRSGDACLEREKNLITDSQGEAGRETILDGQNGIDYSNHVINIAGNAEDITIKKFTIRNGRAETHDVMQPFKEFGGSILIRTATRRIVLDELTIERSQASEKGGCIAIYGDAHPNSPSEITLNKVTLDQCTAVNGGGGLYIGGDAHTITSSDLKITNSATTGVNSKGGGLLIEDNVGQNGAAENVTFSRIDIGSNTTKLYGAGIFIGENATHIKFASGGVSNNKATAANSKGGGVYIGGEPLAPAAAVTDIAFIGITISANEADLEGAGIFLGNTAQSVMVALPNALPAPHFRFQGVSLLANKFVGAAPAKRGAGLMILGPTSDIEFTNATIANNTGNAQGIGLAIFGLVHHVSVNTVVFEGNKVAAGPKISGNGAYVDGASRIEFVNTNFINHVDGLQGAGLFALNVIGLHLENMIFRLNQSSQEGGAAALIGCNIATNSGNKFFNNSSQRKGGALYVDRSLDNVLVNNQRFLSEITQCEFNSAVQEGGCFAGENIESAELRTFVANNNTAGNDGGAGYFDSNLRYFEIGGGSIFGTNTSTNGNGGALSFGFNPVFPASRLEVGLQCIFNANRAVSAGRMGGALFIRQAPKIMALRSGFANNFSHAEGGAVHVGLLLPGLLQQLVIEGNYVGNETIDGDGGALYFSNNITLDFAGGGFGTAIGGTYNRNKAKGLNRVGGALAFGGPIRFPNVTRFKLQTANFDRNEASSHDPALHLAQMPAAGIEFDNTTFSNHTRTSPGCGGLMDLSGVQVDRIKIDAGSIAGNKTTQGDGGVFCVQNIVTALEMANVTVTNNVAQQGRGGFLIAQNINPNLDLRFTGVSATRNQAKNGDGGFVALPQVRNLEINGGDISRNKAQGGGGAFGIGRVNTLVRIFNNALISTNVAENGNGGFLLAQNGDANLDVSIQASTIVENKSEAGGAGGFLATPQMRDFRVNGSIVNSNKAAGAGGVLAVNQMRDINIDDATLDGNTADIDGGVIATPQARNIFIFGSSFTNNVAQGNGGALSCAQANNVTITSNANALTEFFRAVLRRVSRGNADPLAENVPRAVGNSAKNAAGGGGIFHFGQINGIVQIANQAWLANSTDGSGGAFYAGNVLGHVTIRSPLFYGNVAAIDGGVIYLGNLQGNRNLTISQNDTYPDGTAVHYFFRRAERLMSMNDTYPAGRALAEDNLDMLNKIDIARPRTKCGMFLIEENRANGRGGAVFVNNVDNVNVRNMSFANNKSLNDVGGTLFINDLQQQFDLNNSIIFGGEAATNGGSVYLVGSAANNATFWINDSSLQESRVQGTVAPAAGAMYANTIHAATIQSSGFFGNRIVSSHANHHAAAGLMVTNFVGGLGNTVVFLPIPNLVEFKDNLVVNPTISSLGTVLVENVFWNLNFVGLAENGVFDLQNNFPAPVGTLTRNVVGGF